MAKDICTVHKQEKPLSDYDKLIAAGDVSATNVLVGIYSVINEIIHPIFEATYKGKQIRDFDEQVVADMLKRNNLERKHISAAVFSPASPIID